LTTAFLSHSIWPQLTKATRRCHHRCDVAVAYFGQGASRLLPLAKGSRLVVDASERSVGCGQTCPADLVNLVNRGVAVYSVPNLHAKVFVLGRAAYIGSANVSSRAASYLVEAVIRTTERSAVRAARKFVQQQCLHELTPTVLKRLAKLYHAPQIPGGKPGKRRQAMTSERPALPRLLLAQLELEDWSESDQNFHDAGVPAAKKHQQHQRSFELDSFRWTGKCPYQRGNVVIQITDEGSGGIFVSPPANVLLVRTRRGGDKQVSFVYVEQPARRRKQLKALARALGIAQKRLQGGGLIRDSEFAQALLNAWAVTR
jgi:hypothetical protein